METEKKYPCQRCGQMKKREDLKLVGEFRQYCKKDCPKLREIRLIGIPCN